MPRSVIVSIFLPLFSCHQEKSHWEQAPSGRFLYSGVHMGEVPSMGCLKIALVSGLDHPGGHLEGTPPSLALSESAQVSV